MINDNSRGRFLYKFYELGGRIPKDGLELTVNQQHEASLICSLHRFEG